MMQVETKKTLLKENAHFPFCKGCGHHHYVHHLDRALASLDLDSSNICIVSDIGCIGILDSLFVSPHTFHTTHGRSTAFATGIELADGILQDSKLKSIVVIGDGGATIGLLHIVNAALMNVDITVLVANNMLYGMTGGQNSGFSPLEFITPTTPEGNIVPPMDICAVAKSCGAEFVTRVSATDKNLTNVIARAISHPGFALVEIVELCTEFAVTKNKIDGKTLQQMIGTEHTHPALSKVNAGRKEFCEEYKTKILSRPDKSKNDAIKQKFISSLRGTQRWVIAGTAGEKVQLSSYLLMRAGILCGLHATQKNDNPVTQGSGFSLSEVVLSSDEICYTGIDVPDVVILSSADGLKEVRSNGTLGRCDESTVIIADESLPEFQTPATLFRLPLRTRCTPLRATTSAVAAMIAREHVIPQEAMFESIRMHSGDKVSLYQQDVELLLSLFT
ncbi:MAG: thiamine pyrophosphate-dependent enzyme [Bacteroidota bacterium]